MSKHTVIIARHCKAVATAPGSDEKRPLSASGVAQAKELGRALKALVARVDTVFVSPAVRAQQTWDGIAAGAGLTEETMPRVETLAVIYDGSPTQIWEAVALGSTGHTSMVVGHEPTISSLVVLAVKEGEAAEVEWGMPTGSAAIIEADANWRQWHEHIGSIADFVHVSHG